MMIILTVDLILGERNDNRFYFLLETFNKLSIHVSMVSKYFNFKKNFTTDIVFDKETGTNAKIWQIINFKATIENFALFTKLLFKIIQNLNSAPKLQYRLIKMWLVIF
jgi:IS1 family transposase